LLEKKWGIHREKLVRSDEKEGFKWPPRGLKAFSSAKFKEKSARPLTERKKFTEDRRKKRNPLVGESWGIAIARMW